MRCRTPAQKRRRDFKSAEDWMNWALNVLRSNAGTLEINEYSWKTGTRDLLKGLYYARNKRLVRRLHGRSDRATWILIIK